MSIPVPEEWRPVPGFEDFYEVSDLGRVRSLPRTVLFTDGRRRTWPARMLKTYTWGDNPHLQVNIYTPGRNTKRSVHQLVLLAFVGPRPPGPEGEEIRHLDGDHLNNTLSNLVYGSRAENAHDRVRHGTHAMVVKTHCKRGHPFDAKNTAMRAGKYQRLCLECRRINNAASAQRAREKAARISS